MNMSRKNFLRWSAITTGGIVFGTALPACGGGGGGGGAAAATPTATPTAIAAATAPAPAPAQPATGPVTIAANLAASRVTGVAPLYVNFDATGTTHYQSTNPTHELFYSWMFGDTGAGNWANGVQSAGLIRKNEAFGAVSGHVFETPGIYTVNLIVMDGVNTVTKSVSITVQDPNVVYAGTKTICISHSGNFAGAPSGSMQIHTAGNTNMYAAWSANKASNKRILFCKDDTWACSAALDLGGLTGTTVSGYGTGDPHTFASGTLVRVTPAINAINVFQGGGSTDCRICNFKIAAMATHVGVSVSTADSVALTLYKIEVRGATAGFSSTTGGSGASFCKQDQHCIYECLNDQQYGYAGFNPPTFTGISGAVGTPGIFTATGHQFKRFNKVQLSGTVPAGLSAGTFYYISGANLTANTFSLSSTFTTDTPLAISGAGTCDITAVGLSGGIGAFVALTRGGFMGNYLDSCNYGEQTLRIPYVNTSHINNNYLARPNQTKNVVKIHCRGYDDISSVSSGYSEKLVFSANFMDLRGGYSYGEVIPNNGATATYVGDSGILYGAGGPSPGYEHARNGIFENNFTQSCLGHQKDNLYFIAAGGSNVTVRNNIADFSMGDRTTSFLTTYSYFNIKFAVVNSSTPDQTVGVRIFNNTMYSNIYNAETAHFTLITPPGPFPNVDSLVIKNNIWYMPHHLPFPLVKTALKISTGAAPTNVTASNNTDSDGRTSLISPNFVATPPVLLTDWRPNTGSYAIKTTGTPVCLRDFNNVSRYGGFDHLGAVLP